MRDWSIFRAALIIGKFRLNDHKDRCNQHQTFNYGSFEWKIQWQAMGHFASLKSQKNTFYQNIIISFHLAVVHIKTDFNYSNCAYSKEEKINSFPFAVRAH